MTGPDTPAPIAIIGMGCRLPGGIKSPEELWEMVAEGRSGWTEIPSDRWNADAFYHPHPEAKESLNSRSGYFLGQDISHFDARFFNCAGYEAHTMDPQQRILLETTYEALENAGVPLTHLKGSDTSVFVGVYGRDYDRMGYKDVPEITKVHMTGTGEAVISNRISYVFDLKGASMTIDTGCSGSMVALHQAAQTLRLGESRMAIVGGTELLLHPDQSVVMSAVGMVNPEGRCYVFDDRGSGYSRGEGVGTIVLKLLSHAIEDGDPVHAVILNSALNQDGRTAGISLPNPDAQANLMRHVYASVGIDPGKTLYVEAHGTGTQAGDKAEISSISKVFCEETHRSSDLYVGSVKSNIGHLEAASGVAGLIKTIMVLKKRQIPANLDLITPKPSLKLDERQIKIATELVPLVPPGYEGPERASVNSFGYGGTNCHVVLESAASNKALKSVKRRDIPPIHSNGSNGHTNDLNELATNGNQVNNETNAELEAGKAESDPAAPSRLFVLSASTETAIQATAENLQQWLASHETTPEDLEHLSYTLACRRSHLPWRYSVAASSPEELKTGLAQVKNGKARIASSVNVAFVFTGQGAQWHAMGRELIANSACFRDSIFKSNSILRGLGCDWSLAAELAKSKEESRMGESQLSQPCTTAIQIALVDLLAELDVHPKSVVGHSSGEIGAAYAAGALTHEAAISIAYHRGIFSAVAKIVNTVRGSMLAVGLGEQDVVPLVKQTTKGFLKVACVNSPQSVTVSGDEAAIEELQGILKAKDIFNRKLQVDTAYHSHHMEKVADYYLDSIRTLEAAEPRAGVSFFSSVAAARKVTDFGASYWVQNLVSKVRFSDALELVAASMSKSSTTRDAANVFIEIGPHSALLGPSRQTLAGLPDYKYSYFSPLVRNQDALGSTLTLAGQLHGAGYPVNLDKLLNLDGSSTQFKTVDDLVPYPWDHSTRYWWESRLSRDHRLRAFPYHDLVGLLDVSSNIYEPRWRYHINVESLSWLKHHVVEGMMIYPGSGYVCMAIEAMNQLLQLRNTTSPVKNFILRNVICSKPIIVHDKSPEGFVPEVELQLAMSRSKTNDSSPWETFRIMSYSKESDSWSENCSGMIMAELHPSAEDEVEGSRESDMAHIASLTNYERIRAAAKDAVLPEDFYSMLRATGNDFGPTFAALTEIHTDGPQGCATLAIPDVKSYMPKQFMRPHVIHPSTLDAINQLAVLLFKRECSNSPLMAYFMTELVISTNLKTEASEELYVALELKPESKGFASANTWAFQKDENNNLVPIFQAFAIQMKSVGEQVEDGQAPFRQKTNYRLAWRDDADFLTAGRFDTILKSSLHPVVDQLSVQEKLDLNEKVAAIYLRDALTNIAGQVEKIVDPHLVKLHGWMKSYVSSDECKDLLAQVNAEKEPALKDLCAQTGIEGQGVVCMGSNMAGILVGEVDPLALLLEDDLLNRFYSEGLVTSSYNDMVKYIEILSHKKPHMDICEIGAGTGHATLPLIQALDRPEGLRLNRYVYTDASPDVFEHAKTTLKKWDAVIDYKALDMAKDPLQQGFQEAKFDLIIASNALYATPSIAEALANTRKLLKPGGRLLLVELIRPTAAVNTIFGALPSWWASEDDRKDGPLLSQTGWDEVLRQQSFSGIEMASYDDEGPAPRSAMMVSKAVDAVEARQPNKATLLLGNTTTSLIQSVSTGLSTAIEATGIKCTDEAFEFPSEESVEGDDTVYIVLDNANSPILLSPTEEMFENIKLLVAKCRNLLWVSLEERPSPETTAMKALVSGIARVLRRENAGVRFITLDIREALVPSIVASVVDNIISVADRMFWPRSSSEANSEYEYAFADGSLLVPRLHVDTDFKRWNNLYNGQTSVETCAYGRPDHPLKLEVEMPGLLSSLRFVHDAKAMAPLAADEIAIEARAYGVNFRDVFIALGQMPPGLPMVGEVSGIVTAVGADLHSEYKIGDRVMACGAEPFASQARLKGLRACVLPDNMSFAAAASIPMVFLTAYYCLVDVARLEPGQTVLIQAASGGVGQAAIQIAQHLGAEVFATVGSLEKRRLIMDLYSIPETHIFSSRTGKFKQGVMRLTNNRGADVVLNSLAGEMLNDSWECVAPLGTMVEIGKADIYKRSHLSMVPFDRSATFAAVDLLILFARQSRRMHNSFKRVVDMFEKGILHEVGPLNIMTIDNVEAAFRLIAGRKHIGKIIVEAHPDTLVKAALPPPAPLKLSQDGSYLVAGGLGDLGRRISRFLARHGAGHIVTLSRRTLSDESQKEFEEEIAQLGGTLHIVKCDITDEASVREASEICKASMPPVKGIIHSGMVLRDHPMANMSLDDYLTSLGPKVHGTVHLNKAFSSPDLDFFVMLSSVTSIIGKTGQSNYSAGNSFLDAFAHAQIGNANKTRYIALNLGAVDGSEAIASLPMRQQALMRQGAVLMSFDEVFRVLEYATGLQAIEDETVQLVMGFDRESMTAVQDEFALANPMFSMLPYAHGSNNSEDSDGKVDVEKLLRGASSLDEAENMILTAVVERFALFLDRPIEDVSPDMPLRDFGLDSLVSIELKNWIVRTFQATLQVSELTDASSIPALARSVVLRSKLVDDSIRQVGNNDVAGEAGEEAGEEAETETETETETEAEGLALAAHGYECCRMVKELPRHPIPDLKRVLHDHLNNISAGGYATPGELENLRAAIDAFTTEGSTSHRLYVRLVQQANDPSVDSWCADVLLKAHYLRQRHPLVYSSFVATHHESSVPHSQCERAALIATTAFRFKQAVEAGVLEPYRYFDVPSCSDSWNWVFNAAREPGKGEDKMMKYTGDYCVVLRRGHVFKVMLRESGEDASVESLTAIFDAIVDRVQDEDALLTGIFSASDRDLWAQTRAALLEVDPKNAECLQTIDAAAFVVCLDEGKAPSNAERVMQSLSGDVNSFNRWHDKAIQFIVFADGVSSYMAEHSMIDGLTVLRMTEWIHEAIRTHEPSPSTFTNGVSGHSGMLLEEHTLVTTPDLDEQMKTLRDGYLVDMAQREYLRPRTANFGKQFLVEHRLPVKGVFEMMLLLASRLFHGHNAPSYEPVSLAHYHRGRMDLLQKVNASAARFCDAAADRDSNIPAGERREMLIKASNSVNSDLRGIATTGGSHVRLLTMMDYLWPEGEAKPALFDDPLMKKTAPQWFNTSMINGSALDAVNIETTPDTVRVQYSIWDNEATYSVIGRAGNMEGFSKCLREAAEIVKLLVEAV